MMFQCNQNDSKMILLWSTKGFGCNFRECYLDVNKT